MSEHIDQITSGVFIMPFHDPAKPLAQCFDEDLELIIRADELGFDEFWIGEHHTMKYEPIVMPESSSGGPWARRKIFAWAPARRVCSSIIRPTWPGGWRFWITCRRVGSICASAPGA